jgi:hypothetical protein
MFLEVLYNEFFPLVDERFCYGKTINETKEYFTLVTLLVLVRVACGSPNN